ncbi:MAG: hypothetical protein ACI9K1_000349 [Arcticibacterium sp.]|jgi:hypothetical protein
MLPTNHIELDHKTNAKGQSKIYHRVTYSGRSKRKQTGISVSPMHFRKKAGDRKWIKSTHPDSDYLNQKLHKLKTEFSRRIDQHLEINTHFNLDKFFAAPPKEISRCFFQFAYQEFLELIEDDRLSTAKKRRTKHIQFANFYNNTSLTCFSKSRPLYFEDIDIELLTRYRRWLKANGKADNTIIGSLKNLRTVYNQALNKGMCDYNKSPL